MRFLRHPRYGILAEREVVRDARRLAQITGLLVAADFFPHTDANGEAWTERKRAAWLAPWVGPPPRGRGGRGGRNEAAAAAAVPPPQRARRTRASSAPSSRSGGRGSSSMLVNSTDSETASGECSCFTVTCYANLAHNLTRSP